MSKKTIGILYFISLVLEVLLFIGTITTVTEPNPAPGVIQEWLIFALVAGVVCGIPGLIAWIGTLVNLSRAQAWVWFIMVFLFGGIAVLIYLIAGPKPLKKGQVPQGQQLLTYLPPAYSPGLPSQPPAQAYHQPQPGSPLEILYQRYARGEIDSATFEEMRARMEGRLQQ